MKLKISYLILLAIVSISFWSCQKDAQLSDRLSPPEANAGPSQTIQLPASSFTLTGSGTTSNGTITGYLWSLVSGPNVPQINSPSSPVTTVSNFVPGSYIFQFMVIDDAGLTAVDTTKIQVNGPAIQTLTLQPTNNPDERFILGNSTLNQGDSPSEFSAGTWTISGNTVYLRGLFKFDLSSIPAGSTILSAKLSLYSNPTPLNGDQVNANSGANNSFFIRRITSSWVAASTLWLNQPSTTTANQVAIAHTSQSFLDLIDVDVKNLVADMQSGGNNGFMISLQNETFYNIRDFCSSRYSNAAKHPKLVITYQ
jgi:hypothetical protein